MQVINVYVDKKTFTQLRNGKRLLDVRIDVPQHSKGDIIVYTMKDEDGLPVDGQSIAFLITTKVALEEFVERIGEQMMRKGPDEPDDLVIVTLAPVGTGHGGV